MRVLMVALAITLLAMVAVAEDKDPVGDWYGMLEFQGGTTWDFKPESARSDGAGKVGGYKALTGVIGTEIDVDEETEAKGPVAVLAGVTYNLGNLRDWGVDISWAKHFGVNVGFGATYDWNEGVWGLRGMLSIVDLSLSGGGAERQRNR